MKPLAVKSEGEIICSIFSDVGLTVVEIVVWAEDSVDEIVVVVEVDVEIVVVIVDTVVVVDGTVVVYILVVVEDMVVGKYVGLDRIFLTFKKDLSAF